MVTINVTRYTVSVEGIVYTNDRGTVRPLATYRAAGNDYLCVRLWYLGKRVGVQVHRLVAMTHLPPKPFDKAVLRHRDGNKDNNAAGNLEWGTQAQNCADIVVHKYLRDHGIEVLF